MKIRIFVNYFSYIYCEDGGGGTGETAHERLHGLVQDPEENTRWGPFEGTVSREDMTHEHLYGLVQDPEEKTRWGTFKGTVSPEDMTHERFHGLVQDPEEKTKWGPFEGTVSREDMTHENAFMVWSRIQRKNLGEDHLKGQCHEKIWPKRMPSWSVPGSRGKN